jgi:transposase InsO family protein
VEQSVVELRRERPDWGAGKIRDLLEKRGIKLPAGTIHRILLRYDLVRDCDQRPQAKQRFERERPNQLWQMDFKGPKGWNQQLGPLSVLDDHSRYAVALENTGTTQSQAVQAVLERAFRENGMPEEMLMDHGTPWFNTQGRLGWSQRSAVRGRFPQLSLIAMSGAYLSGDAVPGVSLQMLFMQRGDIALYFSGYRHPQTQGKVERFHRSLTSALLRRGVPAEDCRQQAPRMTGTGPSTSGRGEATKREKSMIYRTLLGQNRQGVSWIFCRSSVITLKGNDRRHSVQVSTT